MLDDESFFEYMYKNRGLDCLEMFHFVNDKKYKDGRHLTMEFISKMYENYIKIFVL